MIALRLDRVTLTYSGAPVFADLSWEIHDDRVVGLIGPNGSGKSTLLHLMMGRLTPDAGGVVRARGLTIGLLPQEPTFGPGHSVWAEALTASAALGETEARLHQIEARLGDPDVYGNEARLARALAAQEALLAEYEALGGPAYQSRLRSTLLSLGFEERDFALPVEALSGGQGKLLALAKLMVVQPDLLLLDEPDNHLDLEAKAFLEQYIRGYKGGVVVISHDRYLLDMVVDEVVELEDGRLTSYPGNYSEYAVAKAQRLARQQQHYQSQQAQIRRLERSAERLMTWGKVFDNEKFARRGQAIIKRLERMERIDRPVLERRRMGLELAGWRGSEKVLEISDLWKSFANPAGGEDLVLAGLNLLLWHGERVGVIGPNGAGKSVLLRLILGQETPTEGEVRIGPSVRIGHYAQQHESLDPALSLVETVIKQANLPEHAAIPFLGRFLFPYEQVRKPVATLSGGEKGRLQMALLMLSGANLLLLDEPTNNLDIASAEVLEEALEGFEGTVLVISHDRYLLDRIVDRVVVLDEGGLAGYAGGYSDYEAERLRREGAAGATSEPSRARGRLQR
jgi:ATP-binding cassette subfamily F protein 3